MTRVKRSILALGILAVLILNSACSDRILSSIRKKDQSELIYLFEVMTLERRPSIQIDVLFRGDDDGETIIRLPMNWAGLSRLDRGIHGLQSLTVDSQIRSTERPGYRKVVHKPGEVLHLRYGLVQETESNPSLETVFSPWIQPNAFAWSGGAGLVAPDWPIDRLLEITLRWLSLRSEIKVFDSTAGDQINREERTTLARLFQTAFFGGDFRERSWNKSDNKLRVAIRGDWSFEDSAFFGLSEAIWTEQGRALGASPSSAVVTLIPAGRKCCGFRGIRVRDGAWLAVASDRGLDLDFRRLLSQELLLSRLKLSEAQAGGNPERTGLLLGLAQHLARKSLFTSGSSWADFIADLNLTIREGMNGPGKSLQEDELVEIGLSDQVVTRQWALRADLFMFSAIAEMRRRGWSLAEREDHFKRIVYELKDADGAKTSALILDQVLGNGFGAIYRKSMKPLQASGVKPDWLGTCSSLEMSPVKKFELGFDIEASKLEGRIAGVQKDSAASRAGVKKGQKLLSWRARIGDPDFEVELQVKSGSKTELIRYLPVSRQASRIPQFRPKLAENTRATPESCL